MAIEKLPEFSEELETAILQISSCMKIMNQSRLARKAIVTLISDHSGIGKKTINIVLNNLDTMEEIWLKKEDV